MFFIRDSTVLGLLLALLFALLQSAVAVKEQNFKRCEQSGFCKRNRAFADDATARGSSWTSPYHLDSASISLKAGRLQGIILKNIGPGQQQVRLPLSVSFLESGVVRVVVDEEKRQKGGIELRHESRARKERYNEVSDWTIVGGMNLDKGVVGTIGKKVTIVPYGPNKQYKAIVRHSPFAVDFQRDGDTHVKLNGKGLLNVEHWRPKVEKEIKEGGKESADVPEDESTWWDEQFGGNTDSKPRGPESVGLDIIFPGYEHVFGIPEHASSLSLKETRGGPGNYDQPYRMYNTDVFEYDMNSPMTLYGAIPFMQAHRKNSTVGVFWLNAAETWVDIVKAKESTNPLSLGIGAKTDTETHWISESGLLDIFVFLGPTPKDILSSYSELTGFTALPQYFAIAYHQCRWNYVTDEDVKDVDRKFDRRLIPYDVIWLDIEHTDGKKYFTWDSFNFPDPINMHKHLDKHERKLVMIIDPHIKNEGGYSVASEMKSKSLAVKNKDNSIYEGWCWPGSSHWIDCFNPATTKWWTSLFAYSSFLGTTPSTFIWNDMNEPSVFNGPETTMPKDNLHHGDWEHRDVHNLNGLTFVNATYTALLNRDPKSPRRPFVLTRSFFAGSQRMGAMWTGDNLAEWSHLAMSIPMILSNNIAGFPFAGADIGGFFGNPSKELLVRFFQAGAFYPFMRAHAHIDTRRREPYLVGEPYTTIIAQALRLRYQLLPAWYTAFQEASVSGAPIVRPHYYVHPDDESAFAIDDQFYIGSTGLLAKPVVTEGAEAVDIYLPASETYFDYFDYTTYLGAGNTVTISASLDKIPLLMRGGHIIPRRDRPRRSSGLMRWDPFTLVVVIGKNGEAEGTLYIDDGESFEYENGAFIHRKFFFSTSSSSSTLTSTPMSSITSKSSIAYHKKMEKVRIERIILVNAPKAWEGKNKVGIHEDGRTERSVGLRYEKAAGRRAAWAVVRDPGVGVGKGWQMKF